ncbi:1308_t:CDS:2 [Dentiscutata erythropus]|uniref:1308_t:CDS:1 n=1 Tax=Dentiscutata erythropus TaxID=1348616 RepID=A0A9N9A4Y8_9GLOM|nr:1308_t:CDS:2 [Dentiscutata erythropus]
MDERYTEDSELITRHIKNNPLFFGTLFDCRHSKALGSILSTRKFTRDHFIIHTMKTTNYQLVHVKNTEDKLKTLKVDGSMSAEILSGIINIEGSGYSDNTFSKNLGEEQLICQYSQDNYNVELTAKAREIADKFVKDQLLKNEQNIHFGKMNKASLKASLGKLDLENANNYKMQITADSRPPMQQQLTSIKQVFEFIESIDMSIQKEKHFKFIGSDITGVPIQFKLRPISWFFPEFKVEKLYRQIQDNTLENFLIKLKKYQSSEYIKNRVLKKSENRLQIILSDNQSKLSKEILEFQKKVEKTTKNYFEIMCEALKKYKIGKCTPEELFKIKQNYDKSDFHTEKVHKIESFVLYGKKELSIVHEKDTAINIKYFTNPDKLDEWFNFGVNVKILLRTSFLSEGNSSNNVIRYLTEIADDLQKRGIGNIEVGIAYPSVSDGFSLEIKDYNDSQTYSVKKIPQVLRILNTAIGKENSIESRFYMLYALSFRIQLPLQDFSSLNKHISLLNINHNIHIASHADSLQRIKESKDSDIKFFVSLDADTSFEAICEIKNIVSKDCFSKIEWIFGESGISFLNAAPLILIFYGGKIKAVCLDKLDLLILLQNFENKNFSILSCDSLSHSFYLDRSKFSLEFIKTVDSTNINIHNLDPVNLKIPFNQSPDKTLSDALSVIRTIENDNDDKLKDLLMGHGWLTKNSKFNNEIPKDLKTSYKKLENLLKRYQSFHINPSFHIKILIFLLDQSSNKKFPDVVDVIISKYINRLPRHVDPYKSRWNKIEELTNRKYLPNLVSLLAKSNYDPQLCKLHEQLNKISNVDNKKDIKRMFELLSEMNFTEEHNKYF